MTASECYLGQETLDFRIGSSDEVGKRDEEKEWAAKIKFKFSYFETIEKH